MRLRRTQGGGVYGTVSGWGRPLEAVRFRPERGAPDIEPNSGLDDDGTLLVVADCDRHTVRLPADDVWRGVSVPCPHPRPCKHRIGETK